MRPWRDEAIRLALRTLHRHAAGHPGDCGLLHQLRRVEAGERALRESEERYALAMEGANEGYWDWDIASDRLFLSPKMLTWVGQSGEGAITTRTEWRARVVIHPDDVPRFEATTAEHHLAGRTPRYECEYRVRHPDGEWRWLLARGRCLRDATGEPYRFVGSAIRRHRCKSRRRSTRSSLEAQLRQSQKMEAIGTLAGGIAHDFNNILGAILGYGELAHQHSPTGSALRRYLDNVMHAAERAKTLVDRILGFSRSGLGDREPVNVQSVIRGDARAAARRRCPRGFGWKRQSTAGNAAVIGDATYLHQVAMNLCTNAVHAMDGRRRTQRGSGSCRS